MQIQERQLQPTILRLSQLALISGNVQFALPSSCRCSRSHHRGLLHGPTHTPPGTDCTDALVILYNRLHLHKHTTLG